MILKKIIHKFSFAREGIIALAIKIFGAIFTVSYSLILSRQFNSEGVGLYYLANSIIIVAIIISKFGFENALIKYISIYFNERKGGTIKLIEKKSVKISIILSIILMLLLVSGSHFVSTRIFDEYNLVFFLNIMTFSILPLTLVALYSAIFKGIDAVNLGMITESNIKPLFNILIIGIAIFLFSIDDIKAIPIGYLIGTIFTYALTMILWKKKKNKLNSSLDSSFKYHEVLKTARPLMMVNALNYILSSTDTLMLGFYKTASVVGIYNIATKVTVISSFILVSVNSLYGPKFAILAYTFQKIKLKKMYKLISRLLLCLSIIIFVATILFHKLLLGVFGVEFLQGKYILYIAAIGQFFLLATGPVGVLLMVSGYEKLHRNNTIFCAVLNIVLNAVLIPKYGGEGAAIATSFSLIVKNLYATYIMKREFGFFIY